MKQPQIFRQPQFEGRHPLVLDLYQQRHSVKTSSVERAVSLQKSNENVEQLVDMWQKHKSILTQISPAYHSNAKKSESFIIQEIAEQRECSPKALIFNSDNENYSTLNSARKQIVHKKTQSIYVDNLSRSETLQIKKKENINNSALMKKTQTFTTKKPSKELHQMVLQLQNVKKQLSTLYTKCDKQKKQEIEDKINAVINQVKIDIK